MDLFCFLPTYETETKEILDVSRTQGKKELSARAYDISETDIL